jgi:hypothetical protein
MNDYATAFVHTWPIWAYFAGAYAVATIADRIPPTDVPLPEPDGDLIGHEHLDDIRRHWNRSHP